MAVRDSLIAKKTYIPFFTDNNVEDCVADLLKDSCHTDVIIQDVMPSDSANDVVAINYRQNSLVLINHNVKHFRTIAQQYKAKHNSIDILNCIKIKCHQSIAKKRLKKFLPVIELK